MQGNSAPGAVLLKNLSQDTPMKRCLCHADAALKHQSSALGMRQNPKMNHYVCQPYSVCIREIYQWHSDINPEAAAAEAQILRATTVRSASRSAGCFASPHPSLAEAPPARVGGGVGEGSPILLYVAVGHGTFRTCSSLGTSVL